MTATDTKAEATGAIGTLSQAGRDVHRHDADRFLTVLMAPADRREDLFALYAFNSDVARISEVTSESLLARIRVQWWRDVIAAIHERGAAPAGHPVAEALGRAITRHALSRDLFDALLDARDWDAEGQTMADLDTLDAYVEGTGGHLARLAAQILGADTAAAQEAAGLVGRAYALTGLLRATPFLAAQGRLYLPQSVLDEAGASAETVLGGGPSTPALAAAVGRLATAARSALAEARARRAAVPRAAVAAFLPAVVADGYLGRLRVLGHDVFHPRMALPKHRPLALLLAAWRGRF
jgi:phytoene synthase